MSDVGDQFMIVVIKTTLSWKEKVPSQRTKQPIYWTN